MWLERSDRKDDPRHWVSRTFITLKGMRAFKPNTAFRINCRLPQTPRTPSTAAAHYFDDVFSHSVKRSGTERERIRRSSTTRSIGNRSSFNESLNGDGDRAGAASSHSAVADDEEQDKRRKEADLHVANYVSDQLERIRSNESAAVYEDEFEAQLDGA